MFKNPEDWPIDGPIDLVVHDLPHESATTEWWYVNSHLETIDGRRLSVFASFFRRVVGHDERTTQPRYAHSVIWAIADADTGTYYADSCIDPRAPDIILDILDNDHRDDTLIERALREVLQKNRIPHPDRLIYDPDWSLSRAPGIRFWRQLLLQTGRWCLSSRTVSR